MWARECFSLSPIHRMSLLRRGRACGTESALGAARRSAPGDRGGSSVGNRTGRRARRPIGSEHVGGAVMASPAGFEPAITGLKDWPQRPVTAEYRRFPRCHDRALTPLTPLTYVTPYTGPYTQARGFGWRPA